MPPPEDEFGNEGWQGGERVLRKEVFIDWSEQGYF